MMTVSFMERIPYCGNEANPSSMLGLPRLPDTCMMSNMETCYDSILLCFFLFTLEFMIHWVDFFPSGKLQDGDADEKVTRR